MDVIWIARSPAPLNLPRPLAPTTVPATLAPRGKTVVPPDVFTGPANSPENPSPTLLFFALSVCVIVTGIVVPAGTVKRTGAGGGGGAAGVAATGAGGGATGAAVALSAGGVTGAAAGAACGVLAGAVAGAACGAVAVAGSLDGGGLAG